jgi:DNA-binding NtrC family response regulator
LVDSRTVLFVDDDVLTQWIMTDVLTEAGCDVVSACLGTEASRLLHDAHGFDLLVTDVDLPDTISGPDLGDLWHQALPGRPVLYIGATRHPSITHLGAYESFLSKPFTPEMLLDAVERALEDAAFQPPRPAFQRGNCHVH